MDVVHCQFRFNSLEFHLYAERKNKLLLAGRRRQILDDPCCSFPCKHFGICNRNGFGEEYQCDCQGTGYYGVNCETPYFGQWLKELILPSPQTVFWLTTNGKYVWNVINSVGFLHDFFLKVIIERRGFFPPWPEPHNTAADYVTWDGYANKTFYARTLPAVPENCPSPMGVAGPKVLPNTKELVRVVFERTKFKSCPRGSSVLLTSYAQHFTHQAFKSHTHDRTLSWSDHQIDLSHIYGKTRAIQLTLRTLQGGRMKMQTIRNEDFPPNIENCPTRMSDAEASDVNNFCLGHPFFSLLPQLMYWSTLWLREHNRLCKVLAEKFPNWDDERLFQTARLNVLAQTLSVSTGDYAQSITATHMKLKFQPELIHDSSMRWGSNRIHVEFNTMYHWHSMVPDYLHVGGKNYSLEKTLYNMKPLTGHGMAVFTESLSNQVTGKGPGGRNVPPSLLYVMERALEMNRKARLQSFNRYRQYFRLEPIRTFEDLTGEKILARALSNFYHGDVDAVEFMVGILVEQRQQSALWGITFLEAIGKYAFRTMFANPIGSPEYWRESTFGGKEMFEMSKSTTLQDLACRNIKGCPKTSFRVPAGKILKDEEIVHDIAIDDDENEKDEL